MQFLDGVGYFDAIKTLAGAASGYGRPDRHTNGPAPKKGAHEADDEARRIDRARRTWAEAGPIAGTLAEHYLRERPLALDKDLSHCIRFNARTWWREGDENSQLLRVPCLIAAYRLIDGDAIVAIQKTRLAPGGSKLSRKMCGPVKGAAIKIDRNEDVTYGLTVGEGLETCLAARQLGFRPAWAVGSAGAIGAFPVPGGIDCLTLLGETDDTGANARGVSGCAKRWLEFGKEVILIEPVLKGDANDVLKTGTAAA